MELSCASRTHENWSGLNGGLLKTHLHLESVDMVLFGEKGLANVIRIRIWSFGHAGLYVCSVPQSCQTLCDPMEYSPPGSSAHGISQQERWNGLSFPPPERK